MLVAKVNVESKDILTSPTCQFAACTGTAAAPNSERTPAATGDILKALGPFFIFLYSQVDVT